MSQELIQYRLKQLEDTLRDHTEQDNDNFKALQNISLAIRLDIQTLKTKAGMWGGLAGGLVAALVTACITYFFSLIPITNG